MTAYIANHRKKLRIFGKREAALRRAVLRCAEQEELLGLAAEVHEAKLRVFKCEFAKDSPNQPSAFDPQEAALTNKRLARWLDLSLEETIEICRRDEALPP